MRFYVLYLGENCIDRGRALTPGLGEGERIHVPVLSYVLRYDDGRVVLIDTGMNRVHIDDPRHTWRGHDLDEVILPVMRPEDDIEHQLAEIGVSTGDVTHVINTHLHFDHAGGNALFPNIPIIVQRQHYHYALDNPLFPNENWNLPALTYELVDGELDIFPEIRVVPTPGHAPGHQSVLMRLGPSRNFVLCGDAILCRENLDRHLWSGQADPETAQRTGSLLVDLARQEEALLVFGHDPSQWRQLKRAPDFYEEDGRLSG